MTDRDYLWCALNLLLDDEEKLNELCPACRTEAEEPRCPVCGRGAAETGAGTNAGFDFERFQALSRGATE